MVDTLNKKIRTAFESYSARGWYDGTSKGMTGEVPLSPRRAAVLCCIREGEDGELLVLLTIRSMNVSSHIGEPCFPGGKEEPHDASLYQTALREAEEEVNLKPHQVRFVGFLPPFIIGIDTVKLIYPVVVTLGVDFDSLVLKPNEEVERIFWMPLRIFLGGSDNHLKSLTVKRGTHRMVTNIFWFHNEDENYHYQVFGFTGSICIVLAVIIYNEPTHFPFNCRSIDPSSISWIGDTRAIIRFRELQLFSNFPSLKSKL